MAYQLKTTGIAANCTMCIAVDPDTNTVKDFASASVTAGITVDAGISIGQQDWDGNVRKYIQLAAGNHVNFTGAQPVFNLGTAPSYRTIVWIGEAAGGDVRAFGTGSSDYFASQDASTGSNHPLVNLGSTKFGGGLPNVASGQKVIFGFSLERGAASVAYSALHNDTSMTSAATSTVSVGANWSLATIGRRNASSTQQNDKIHAVLIFDRNLTGPEWDSLRDDWFGVLLESTSPTAELTGSITLENIDCGGSIASNIALLTGGITLADVLASGNLGLVPGSIRTLPFARNNGTRPTGLINVAVAVLSDDANLSRIAGSAAITQNGDGTISFSGAGLPGVGTSVIVITREPDGKLGAERYLVT